MRVLIGMVTAAALGIGSASAQVALPRVDEIGATAHRDLWCGAAFGLARESAERLNAPSAEIEALQSSMTVLFQYVAIQMQAKGLMLEQYDALITRYEGLAGDPFAPGDAGFSRADCDAAATQAEAAMGAARVEQRP